LTFDIWMFLNHYFQNTSVIMWWSLLLVEESGLPGKNPPTFGK